MAEEKWQKSENECVDFLKRTYSSPSIRFDHKGGSDSSQSDIELWKNGSRMFYIEAKSAAAQCGQFVVLDQSNTFIYSPQNKVQPPSIYSKQYLKIMQDSYQTYKGCGTSGSDFCKSYNHLAYDWVKDYYSNHKKTKYVIVEKRLGDSSSSNFLIFPINRIDYYFDISATYRVKKSGSNNPNQGDTSEILNVLRSNGIQVTGQRFDSGKHYFVCCSGLSNKQQIQGPKYKWQFNLEKPGEYQVRKLSNTNNANVIFSISLKQNVKQDPNDLSVFINELK